MVWATTGVAACEPNVLLTGLALQECESTATTHALAGVSFFVGVALILIGFIPRNRR
jgi:hypothetical protein